MAKQFVKNNPYLLNTYEGEYEFDYANDLFADKFLSISALKPDYRHIKEMLSESFDFNLCDDQGQTLLCLLIMDEKDTIKYADLLKVGVSVNTPDNDGKTPLAYAVALGAQAKVEALLRYGAVVDGDMITDKYPNSFRTLLCEVFETQYCCVCEKHPESMSNIPCLKRHRGRFICKDCYESAHSQCPLCNRSMDQYGA